MNEKSSLRRPNSCSDNLKSKIQNRKWGGTVAIALTFALCGVVVEAQQPKKIPTIGYLSSFDPATESPAPRPFGWLFATLAT
jgi:hypothetical protein